jgi:hypothetical protein
MHAPMPPRPDLQLHDANLELNSIISALLSLVALPGRLFIWSGVQMFELLLNLNIQHPKYVHHGLLSWEINPDIIVKWEIEPSGIFLLSRLFQPSTTTKNTYSSSSYTSSTSLYRGPNSGLENQKSHSPLSRSGQEQKQTMNQEQRHQTTNDFWIKMSLLTRSDNKDSGNQYVDTQTKALAASLAHQTQYAPLLLNVPMAYLIHKSMEFASIKHQEAETFSQLALQKEVIQHWKNVKEVKKNLRIKVIDWVNKARYNWKEEELKIQNQNEIIAKQFWLQNKYKKTILHLQRTFRQRVYAKKHYLVSKYGIFLWFQKIREKKRRYPKYVPVSVLISYIHFERTFIRLLCTALEYLLGSISEHIESLEFWEEFASFDQLLGEIKEIKRRKKAVVIINDQQNKKYYKNSKQNNNKNITTVQQFATKQRLKPSLSKPKLKKWTEEAKKISTKGRWLIIEDCDPDTDYIRNHLVSFLLKRINLLFRHSLPRNFKSILILMPLLKNLKSCLELLPHFFKTLARLKHHLMIFDSTILKSLVPKRSDEIIYGCSIWNEPIQLRWEKKFCIPAFVLRVGSNHVKALLTTYVIESLSGFPSTRSFIDILNDYAAFRLSQG